MVASSVIFNPLYSQTVSNVSRTLGQYLPTLNPTSKITNMQVRPNISISSFNEWSLLCVLTINVLSSLSNRLTLMQVHMSTALIIQLILAFAFFSVSASAQSMLKYFLSSPNCWCTVVGLLLNIYHDFLFNDRNRLSENRNRCDYWSVFDAWVSDDIMTHIAACSGQNQTIDCGINCVKWYNIGLDVVNCTGIPNSTTSLYEPAKSLQ